MADTPTPNQDTGGQDRAVTPSETASPAQVLYQAGLRALQAKNYRLALDSWQRLEQMPAATAAERVKAKIALVQVHQRLGNLAEARDRCQALCHHPSPQVQRWASQTLATLPAVAPAAETPPKDPPFSPGAADRTGFMPLATSPGLPSPRPAAAKNPSDTDASTPVHQPAARSSQPVPDQPRPPKPLAKDSTGADASPPSLFHYDRLNHALGDDLPPEPGAATRSPAPPLAEANPAPAAHPDPTVPTGASAQAQHPHPTNASPQPLPRPLGLWLGQVLTALVVVGVVLGGLYLLGQGLHGIVRGLRLPLFYRPPTITLSHIGLAILGLGGLILATPWLMDGLLTWGYGQRRLSVRHLQAEHPQVLRLLRQVCRHYGWPIPELRLLPDPAPLCLSYGWLPRNTRIVMSQGLWDHCSEEELTALVSHELAHMANRGTPVPSGLGLGLLALYTGYWRLALWGNGVKALFPRLALGLLANGLYGLFGGLRLLGLWLSRLRTGWGDRAAIAILQRPDLHQQGLLKLTDGIGRYVRTQQQLHPLHRALDSLLPLSPAAALSPGSFIEAVGLAAVIQEDWQNPYRQWLLEQTSHPPLGDRLYTLGLEAQRRRQPAPVILPRRSKSSAAIVPKRLLLQKSRLVGCLAGGSLALGLWFVGGVVNRLGWQWLSWLYQDVSLLWGGTCLGLGLGWLLRINSLYPDISARLSLATSVDFFPTPAVLPVQGQPQRVEGRLIGSPGLANWLGQDLYLDTPGGLLRLTAGSPLIAWKGLRQSPQHPANWIGQPVVVAGWQRRSGGQLQIEISTLSRSQSNRFTDNSPLWATFGSLALCLWGLFILLVGN